MIPAIQRPDRKHYTVKKHNSFISIVNSQMPYTLLSKGKKTAKTPYPPVLEEEKLSFWLLFVSSLLSILNITLIYYESELIYSYKYGINEKTNALRGGIIASCISHSLIILKFHAQNEPSKDFKEQLFMLFTSAQKVKKISIDIFIAFVHIPPGVAASLEFTQLGFYSKLSFTDVVFPFCFLRLKFVMFFISFVSKYNDKRTKFVLSWLGIQDNVLFMIKAYIKEAPFKTASFCFGISVLIIGVNIRVFEKTASPVTLWDGFWLGFLTESTIGYGDLYAKTHIGRLISGIAAVIGVFIFSYNVVAVRDFIDLSNNEISLCKKLRHSFYISTQLKPKAAIFIQKFWKAKKSKSLREYFSLISEGKRFSFLRKFLNQDISRSLEEQILEIEKSAEKAFKKGAFGVRNVEIYTNQAHKLMKTSYFNMKKTRMLCGTTEQENSDRLSVSRTSKIARDSSSLMKLRSKAVKNLFIRKVVPSPNASPSPSLSFVDLE